MKSFSFLFLLLLLLCLLTACGGGGTPIDSGEPPAASDSAAESLPIDTRPAPQPPFTVKVICTIPDGVVFSGGDTVQTVMTAAEFEPLTLTVGEDYVYSGYEIDGQRYEGNTVILPEGELTGDTEIRVLVSYLTSELPVVSVHTNGNAVESRNEYVDMTLSLTGAEQELISVPGLLEIVVYEGQSRRGQAHNAIVAEIFPDLDFCEKNGITDIAAYFKPFIDEYNKGAVAYKKIAQLKVRREEFPKNTLRKIMRFKLDMSID